MLQLNYRDSRPIYEQVKDGLRKLVISGAIAPDEKLPSVRSLARELGVNPNTIQKAYQDMEKEGIIYSVAGKGSFVNDITSVKQKEMASSFDMLSSLCRQLKDAGADKAQVLACVEKIFSEEEQP